MAGWLDDHAQVRLKSGLGEDVTRTRARSILGFILYERIGTVQGAFSRDVKDAPTVRIFDC